jgi:MoxR-like ATPase
VLVEGVPGLGKTLLVKALARTISGSFGRIQFTPDLMPADVTGHTLYDPKNQVFTTRRGPVFVNLLLADEINRAPAKTQAALLEVMQEAQVTIEGEAHKLEPPFMVLATQNPIEQEGTYALPEAQLDRFLLKVKIDYPSQADELALVRHVTEGKVGDKLEVEQVQSLVKPSTVTSLQAIAASLRADDAVLDYAIRLVRATRSWAGVVAGAGPRGAISIVRAARAAALLEGRDFVTPDDVKRMALPGAAPPHHAVAGAGARRSRHRRDPERPARENRSPAQVTVPSSRLLWVVLVMAASAIAVVDLPDLPASLDAVAGAFRCSRCSTLFAGLRLPAPVLRARAGLARAGRAHRGHAARRQCRGLGVRMDLHDHSSGERRGRRPAAARRAQARRVERVAYQVRPVARGETQFQRAERGCFRRCGSGGSPAPVRRRRSGLSQLPRAGEVHAARHRQPPVADRRAAGAPARRGHGIPPAARVPAGRSAARHRLEGHRAHPAPDRARVRGGEGPARAAGDRLRPAHGGEGRRPLALRPRAKRRAAARARGAAPGRRGRHDDDGRRQPLQRAAQVGGRR